jgi:hypothetical protein
MPWAELHPQRMWIHDTYHSSITGRNWTQAKPGHRSFYGIVCIGAVRLHSCARRKVFLQLPN